MKEQIEISPYDNLLVYKKEYTSEFVKKTITQKNLNGLRIFDHLDELENLDFLVDYHFLQRLDVDCINDKDFSFLKYLDKLQSLHIGPSVNEFNMIDLSNQTNLVSLSIKWRKNKIKGIEKCRNIVSIYLIDFKEKNLRVIDSLDKLNFLSIKKSSISSLDGIENFNNLQTLLIGNCKSLKSISKINNKQYLNEIKIEQSSNIDDYEKLDSLPKLKTLEFINCKGLKSIEFIKNFSSLKKLSLLGNTYVADGNMISAQKIEEVIYVHRSHYNCVIKNEKYNSLINKNIQIIKNMFK